jgi:hypothetical protein
LFCCIIKFAEVEYTRVLDIINPDLATGECDGEVSCKNQEADELKARKREWGREKRE